MTELTIHGRGLDQPLPISKESLDDIFQAVDKLVEHALKDGDPMSALEGGKNLIEGVQLRGVALMRLLYKLYGQWAKFGLQETFQDRIYVEWGLSKQTINRYIDIWRAVFDNDDVPNKLLPALAERPVNTLRRLVRPVNENKLVDASDWVRITQAEDDSAVRRIIEELSGKSSRGRPALQLLLYSNGELVVVEGSTRSVLAIVKNSPTDLADKLRAKGLERLRNGAGVLDI